jgi:hypothetical protein
MPAPAGHRQPLAEKFGLIESVDTWMEIRKLRNHMVHEYIKDLAMLTSALLSGHAFVPVLVQAARKCNAEVSRVLQATP